MNCQQVQHSLGDHSVGLLDPETTAFVEQHVQACPPCAMEYRRFQRILVLLDHTSRPQPPTDLWTGVRARLDLERAVTSHTGRTPAKRANWLSYALATAGGAAVGIGIFLNTTGRPAPTSMATATNLPPVVLNVSRHNTMDGNAPLADGATITTVESVSLRGAPLNPVSGQTGGVPR